MNEHPRICLVCAKALPANSRRSMKYCSDACRVKASYRRSKQQPISDPEDQTHELKKQLALAQKRIMRLEALVKRQREISARNRTRANDAKSAVATARDRQRKTEMEKTQALEERISAYLKRIADMEVEAETLRRQHQVDVKDIANYHAAHDFALEQSMRFKKQMKAANATIGKLRAALGAPPAIFVDYQYFARWYFRKKPRREWDDHDHNRLLRLNAFSRAASAAAQGQVQQRRPKTRVRMNRFQ